VKQLHKQCRIKVDAIGVAALGIDIKKRSKYAIQFSFAETVVVLG